MRGQPFFLLFVLWMSLPASAGGWRAGTARTRLTPDRPIQMAGFGARNVPAEGRLSELFGKSLVLEDATGQRALLITLDLVGIHADTANHIKTRITHECSLQAHQIVINCSHTHSGPVVGQNLAPLHYLLVPASQQRLLDEFESTLIDRVIELAKTAIDDLEPCSVTHGRGLCTVAVNRRENPATEVAERRALGTLVGPFDHDVPVLAIRRSDQTLKTIVFGYACHATVLNGRQWSGDYPGFAQSEVERRFPKVNAMFWAGCGADQNPLPRRNVELAKSYGERLAAAVSEVIDGSMKSIAPSIQTSDRSISLLLVELPTVSELQKLSNIPDQKYEQGRAKYLLARLGDRKQLEDSYPYPIATWHLGDNLRWVFLGGEVVVDYALAIKSDASDAESVWVAGYCNDVMAYIPSRRVLAEGGYEGGKSNVYYGLPGQWAPNLERAILTEVKRQRSTPSK